MSSSDHPSRYSTRVLCHGHELVSMAQPPSVEVVKHSKSVELVKAAEAFESDEVFEAAGCAVLSRKESKSRTEPTQWRMSK